MRHRGRRRRCPRKRRDNARSRTATRPQGPPIRHKRIPRICKDRRGMRTHERSTNDRDQWMLEAQESPALDPRHHIRRRNQWTHKPSPRGQKRHRHRPRHQSGPYRRVDGNHATTNSVVCTTTATSPRHLFGPARMESHFIHRPKSPYNKLTTHLPNPRTG